MPLELKLVILEHGEQLHGVDSQGCEIVGLEGGKKILRERVEWVRYSVPKWDKALPVSSHGLGHTSELTFSATPRKVPLLSSGTPEEASAVKERTCRHEEGGWSGCGSDGRDR